MRLSEIPTFREFLAANKDLLTKELPILLGLLASAVLIWRTEKWIPGILPDHYVFEVLSFAYAGIFMARLKKLWLPSWLMVLISYLGSVLFALLLVTGFEPFWIMFVLLLASPYPLTFALARLKQALKQKDTREGLKKISKSFLRSFAALFLTALLGSQIIWNPAAPVLNKFIVLGLEISAAASAIFFHSYEVQEEKTPS